MQQLPWKRKFVFPSAQYSLTIDREFSRSNQKMIFSPKIKTKHPSHFDGLVCLRIDRVGRGWTKVAQRCKNKTSRNEFSLENSFDRLGFCVKSLRLEKGYSRHACINLVESACVGERSLVRLKLYHVLMIGWSFYSVVEWKHTTASWVEILEQKQNAKNPFVSCRNENNFFCQETSPMVYVDRFLRVKYFQISGSLPSTASSSQEWINHISPIEASIV